MGELSGEVKELIARIEAMTAAVNGAGPAGGGTFDALRAAAGEAIDAIFTAAGGVRRAIHSEADYRIPVAGGDILARAYTPAASGPLPGLLHFHGGAWVMGSIGWPTFQSFARDVAEGVPCVVLDVEYRLAPEHRFPTGLEDCYASLRWLAEHADELGVDPRRIAVGGDSAGANLAAAVCLMSRDRGGPQLVGQLLESPAPDHAHLENYSSARAFATGYGLDTEDLVLGRGAYYADPADALDQYASPLLADGLSGLPRAHVMTAEFDPLRDGGEAYGGRLLQAGVPAVVSRHPGHIHGASLMLHPRWEGARSWRAEVIRTLRSFFRDGLGPVSTR